MTLRATLPSRVLALVRMMIPTRRTAQSVTFGVANAGGFANGLPDGGTRAQVGRPGDSFVLSAVAPPRQLQFSARWVL